MLVARLALVAVVAQTVALEATLRSRWSQQHLSVADTEHGTNRSAATAALVVVLLAQLEQALRPTLAALARQDKAITEEPQLDLAAQAAVVQVL